ncbi:TcmI family type II polyketide cyclase [Actinoplanes sp. NPDC051411]|uniref:TcmI family type II polyketide cyclase n=1 Tax=Actinoplanes sp. NPDC051411 TaxID=3155522 RepID=UPI0034321062
MNRTLIVAKADPGDLDRIADLFTRSDATELPHLVGVRRRTLFTFHDLYFHLIESERPAAEGLARVRENPLWHEINTQLKPYVQPYHPSWQGPADATAHPFYTWSA